VIDFPWRDDFAAARNASLAESTCEWNLVLDADERLQPVRPVEFQRLLKAEGVAGYRVQVLAADTENPLPTCELVRLFRGSPDVRYRYPIHERVTPALHTWAACKGLSLRDASLTVIHGGSRLPSSIEKRDRNLRILRAAVAAYPDEPYFEYQLACENLVLLDEEVLPVAGMSTALANLERSWQKVLAVTPSERGLLAYGTDLTAKMAACHLAAGRVGRARRIVRDACQVYGDQPALLLQGIAATTRHLVTQNDDLVPRETARLLAAVRRDIEVLGTRRVDQPTTAVEERIRVLYPLRYLGELALLEGQVSEAAELFEKALTIDSSYSSAWLGLAECARYAGDRKRALKLYLRTVTENELNHHAWLRGCSLLEELEFHDNADSWRRKVAIHFPEHPININTSGVTGDSRPALQLAT
jgi:tetratricopeptide (TPR) repeat protein